ncbi:hypothetical protein FE257_004638 [Aspergillus nanangensis]|uniref:FAD-binding PCMH-type domain-containing protein n=1 Tax=Aspergillus nanangensis TaxID=2582783 RepID=A0AAD4CYH8_ASPNN|nr:hypothetical protein FE257_004638 [Aspergillus nanangensis]
MAEYQHLATPHPQWADYPNNLPPGTRPVGMTRDRLPIQPQPGLDIEEFDISARDGYLIRIRSYRQSDTTDLPLLVYLHGGGFVTGGLETDEDSCRLIAANIPVVVLNVEYRLAPENLFPVGFEDSMDVVRWAASSAGQIQLSTNLRKGFILGGTSAGANFTAGIAHRCQEEYVSPSLTGLLFLAGSFCHPDVRPPKYLDRILSIDEITDAPGLTKQQIDYFAAKYAAPPDDKRRSPLLYESHAGVALRAAFYICGWDPRRDESFLFEKLLQEGGVQTQEYIYPGLPHGFWTTCPDLEVSKAWQRDLLEGVKFVLGMAKNNPSFQIMTQPTIVVKRTMGRSMGWIASQAPLMSISGILQSAAKEEITSYVVIVYLAVNTSVGAHYAIPHQSCWPSPQDWKALNQSIDGNLVAVRPIASVCHGDANNAACKTVTEHWTNSTWRAMQPGGVLWENWEAWPERNQSCYIEDIPTGPCEQGRISLFSAGVQSASHIQQAVRFARDKNLRLAIKNSGHDYLGRSVAPESLQILTNSMRDIKLTDNFTPTGAPPNKNEGPAVTIAAGVSLQELYAAVGAKNRTVVAGAAHTVGAAGGYIQGGGHSFLGPWKGMAADNAIEFTVVTATNGDLVTANEYQNPDLFWALRGGGGGTFGVVVNVTLRTFNEAPVVVANFNITSLGNNPHFWDAMAEFHRTAPSLNDAAGGGYYYLTPNVPLGQNNSASSLISIMIFPNQSDPSQIDRLYNPLIAKLNSSLPDIQTQYVSLSLPSVDSVIWNFLLQGSDADSGGTISLLGSRLFSRDLFSSQDGAARLSSTLRKFDWTPSRTFIGHLVAGGAVKKPVDSALHPAWRKTGLHLAFGREWATNASLAEQRAIRDLVTKVEVPMLRSVEGPHAMGAYVNEANAYETDFQASFWGANYRRLYQVKRKWDPKGLFVTRRGVGSEDWDDEGLCRLL